MTNLTNNVLYIKSLPLSLYIIS